MKKIVLACMLACMTTSYANQKTQEAPHHVINFNKVPILELIRFISKISKVNFIFDEKELNFEVSFISGRAASSEELLSALVTLLDQNGFSVSGNEGTFVVEKRSSSEKGNSIHFASAHTMKSQQEDFAVYKLEYHIGSEILQAVKSHVGTHGQDKSFERAISSMQWIESTNSLLYSGTKEALKRVHSLIKKLDVAQKQVFIEVLVLETNLKNASEFGLNWSVQAKSRGNFRGGMTNLQGQKGHLLTSALKAPPEGQNLAFPTGQGFDLGVIGDIIRHKGRSFLSLASLVSAVETDRNTSVVLNQTLVAQDNKESTIFVGDNIPFAGSVVSTVGASQQTTSNIEYRDVGVSLKIKPFVGEKGDKVTLEISEEITEAEHGPTLNASNINGIQTSKTNMITKAHVPDQNFLALTGMVKNKTVKHRSAIPCLGGLPLVGPLFSKTEKRKEKRNVIIFVRPHILTQENMQNNHSADEKKES